MLKVINLLAGPGAGKSTIAAGLFHLMKIRGKSVELVTEYAKDMTWERRHNVLSDQIYMFAKQHRRIHRLVDDVEWVVTDSPLIFSLIYAAPDYPQSFRDMVCDFWNKHDNRNYYIERKNPYDPKGRRQTIEEALKIDRAVKDMLHTLEIAYTPIPGNEEAPETIYGHFFD